MAASKLMHADGILYRRSRSHGMEQQEPALFKIFVSISADTHQQNIFTGYHKH